MKDETVHLLLKRTPMCTELPIHTTKGNRPGACIAIARAQQGAGMVGVVRAAGAAGTAGTAGTGTGGGVEGKREGGKDEDKKEGSAREGRSRMGCVREGELTDVGSGGGGITLVSIRTVNVIIQSVTADK